MTNGVGVAAQVAVVLVWGDADGELYVAALKAGIKAVLGWGGVINNFCIFIDIFWFSNNFHSFLQKPPLHLKLLPLLPCVIVSLMEFHRVILRVLPLVYYLVGWVLSNDSFYSIKRVAIVQGHRN